MNKLMQPYYQEFTKLSFSQEGEDLILDRLFGEKRNGFYIDIGAHHPYKYSNTFNFYLRGWRGINIDAMPGSMKLFDKTRKRDINIEAAIAAIDDTLSFHIFNDTALNTFHPEVAKRYSTISYFKLIEKRKITTQKLGDILEKHIDERQIIDFMSIDVEGYDLSVLMSNNWVKFRPNIILIEILDVDEIENAQQNEIYNFLLAKGYRLFSRTYNTFIFKLYQD